MPDSEPTPDQTAETAPEAPPAEQPTEEAPPWGDDFDPARAWDKLKKANAEAKNLRERVLTPEQRKEFDDYRKLADASKSELQRKDEAAQTAATERDEAKSEALRYKIALRHGISEDDFDLLGSGDEEQIEARAAKIAAKNEAAKQVSLDATVATPTAPAPRRPTEQLRPGASPSADPVQSDDYYPAEWLTPTQRARVESAGG